jgi:hypothetical protein
MAHESLMFGGAFFGGTFFGGVSATASGITRAIAKSIGSAALLFSSGIAAIRRSTGTGSIKKDF